MESELIIADSSWEESRDTVMVIDVVEYEEALRNLAWRTFCEQADAYLSAHPTFSSADIKPNMGTGTTLG